MVYVILAWVRGVSEATPPIAKCETKSVSIAKAVAKTFEREGFRIERFERED